MTGWNSESVFILFLFNMLIIWKKTPTESCSIYRNSICNVYSNTLKILPACSFKKLFYITIYFKKRKIWREAKDGLLARMMKSVIKMCLAFHVLVAILESTSWENWGLQRCLLLLNTKLVCSKIMHIHHAHPP